MYVQVWGPLWPGADLRGCTLRLLIATMTTPPGVNQEGPLVAVHVGGEGDWIQYRKIKVYTNCFIKQEGKVRPQYH